MRKAWIALAMIGTAAAPAERIVPGDGMVEAIVNGQALRWRIDPAAPSLPILTRVAADRVKLRKQRALDGLIYSVGREQVAISTGRARLGTAWRMIGWAPRDWAPGLDGVVGPGGVDAPVVRFVFQMRQPGEREVTLPMLGQDGLGGNAGGLFAAIYVDGRPMRVRFEPHRPRTLATASAATRIARAFDGHYAGAAAPAEIAWGIARPVRPMRLARPIGVGPLAIDRIGVRTADVGRAGSIREAGDDPDEILVNAGERADPARDRLTIGADWLRRCSELVFDKPAATVRLRCLPGEA